MVKLQIKTEAIPVHHKVWPVSLALQSNVEKEIDRLINENIRAYRIIRLGNSYNNNTKIWQFKNSD